MPTFRTKAFLEDLGTPLAALIALGFGVAAGVSHLSRGGLQTPAIIEVVGASLATVVCSRSAWRWAIIVMLALPVSYLAADLFGLHASLPTAFNRKDAALVFGTPLLAALVLSMVFWAIRLWRGDDDDKKKKSRRSRRA